MIYGEPGIHIDDDQTDRIGIRTLVLSQMWQPSRWPLTMAELLAETPAAPEVPGGLWFIGRQTRRATGTLRTTWTFEGVDGDGKSVTFKTRGNSPDYRFEPGFAQVDILVHPEIQSMLTAYEGTLIGDQIFWSPTLSGGVATGLGGGQSGQLNPMFGVKDWFRLEGTYIYRYVATDLAGVKSGVGRIHKGGLPGEAPNYTDRDWLKAPSPWRRRGPVFDIQEIYWLSGPGGWPQPVYGSAQK